MELPSKTSSFGMYRVAVSSRSRPSFAARRRDLISGLQLGPVYALQGVLLNKAYGH
jgi:hypothetical protein